MTEKELDDVLHWIESMDSVEMDAILSAIIRRCSLLHPGIEMICLFLPRDDMKERKRILHLMVEFLLKIPSDERS